MTRASYSAKVWCSLRSVLAILVKLWDCCGRLIHLELVFAVIRAELASSRVYKSWAIWTVACRRYLLARGILYKITPSKSFSWRWGESETLNLRRNVEGYGLMMGICLACKRRWVPCSAPPHIHACTPKTTNVHMRRRHANLNTARTSGTSQLSCLLKEQICVKLT